mmetsp:Transcript_17300/g.40155  ORF Transcript_17300/g.40155 Transcript_17300/m.40155 type:complete len:118 (-) Transcript_17300:105-458(-)
MFQKSKFAPETSRGTNDNHKKNVAKSTRSSGRPNPKPNLTNREEELLPLTPGRNAMTKSRRIGVSKKRDRENTHLREKQRYSDMTVSLNQLESLCGASTSSTSTPHVVGVFGQSTRT